MREDEFIRKLTEGREMPFRVPEGYFEGFTERMMSRLPAEGQEQVAQVRGKSVWLTWGRRVWKYAAAVVVVCGVGLGALTLTQRQRTAASLAEENASETQYGEEYINDALDYAIVRNSDIELYLTEAQ